MSFLKKSAQLRSTRSTANLRNGNGFTLSASRNDLPTGNRTLRAQTKDDFAVGDFALSASVTEPRFDPSVNFGNGNGLTLSASQPQESLPTVNLKNGNDFTLSASAEQLKVASPAVSFSMSNGSLSALAEQSPSALPAVTLTNGNGSTSSVSVSPVASLNAINGSTVSAFPEQPPSGFPAVSLSTINGSPVSAFTGQPPSGFPSISFTDSDVSTMATSAEESKLASSAVSFSTSNDPTSSAFAEQPQSGLSAFSLTNSDGLAVSASAEQAQFAFPEASLSGSKLALTASVGQPKVTFSAAGFGTSDGSRLSAVAEPAGSAFLGTNLGNGNVGSALSASTEYTSSSFTTEQRMRTGTISGFGNRPITPTIADTRSVIQKGEWLEAARRSTEYFKTYGSSVPLVWVLTQGNKIPDNAVPFGEDRNGCTLYIARALLEGGLHIGKASAQYGAVIGYAGRERAVTNYEVLVFASQLRWGFPSAVPEGILGQGTVVLSQQRTGKYRDVKESINITLAEGDIPRIIRDRSFDVRSGQAGLMGSSRQTGQMGRAGLIKRTPQTTGEDAEYLKRLAEVKTVIVIDDSLSMQEGNLWEQAREALGGIVDIANRYGSNGADIHFMHSDDYTPNMQSKSEVDALFRRVVPEGEHTPTGAKLGDIINHYVPLVEDERSTHEPIVVVVITDGLPTDQAELDRVIVDVANRLDARQVKQDMFRIQFVQIGTDPAASALLRILDGDLVNRYKIRDMVDCTPYDPAQGAFDTEYMLKVLLGGLRKDLDRVGSYPNGGQSGVLSPTGTLSRYERPSPQGLTARLGNAGPRSVSPRPVY